MKYLTSIILALISTVSLYAQEYSVDAKNSKLEVFGTSTLHDWELKAETISGSAKLTTGDKLEIQSLSFKVKGESLKSGKESMEKDIYEALKTDDHPYITFQFKTAKSVSASDLTATGTLEIAGVSKSMSIPVKYSVENGVVKFVGKVSFEMTDFKIDPPTALLGTLKCGDEVTVSFNVQYTK
ncbi:YceI family protein [Fulvivirga ligni]|uniref:YceI family protein n=1 Tax=Fulvivirga ligni TaxID=2904246 RepID=UPI001F202427|nr:YceI family protein [Fulvivirga ligni]UII19559.1 YceI family protein [Fulvivirga ligni]